jgi:hypothetical protein
MGAKKRKPTPGSEPPAVEVPELGRGSAGPRPCRQAPLVKRDVAPRRASGVRPAAVIVPGAGLGAHRH